jgi:hypothetical protein
MAISCWHCAHYAGLDSSLMHAVCSRQGKTVCASPLRGCVFWERLPGVDEEPKPPPAWRGAAAGEGWRDLAPPAAALISR